ncbi:hypothetical protein SLS64_012549 [Diaporthe eres]|uniref:Uncharacterized protein n=1 Tax=Diaporthe eres TaxID=83184 RepID=A0ABR1PF59_DIAER
MIVSMRGYGPVPKPFSTPASPQDQSPLFSTLPVEMRRHIYKQLWLDCGLTQHILALTPKSYLQSFPCILSREELAREPGPPPPPPDAAGDAVEPDPPQEHDDDPGDINGALQDLSGGGDDTGPATDLPWCVHYACFRRWSRKWDHSFSSMYTAAYRHNRGRPDLVASPVLTSFLVCRRVYAEASESLFSSVRFAFTSLTAMRVFISQVPRPLVARVQFADIVAADMPDLSHEDPVDNRTPAQQVYRTLRASFPNLRELRLTLHHHPDNRSSRSVPKKQELEPLYALAREAGSLRRFEVFLPTECMERGELGYGDVPPLLRDAPFSARVVPPGWHELGDCAHFVTPIPPLSAWD